MNFNSKAFLHEDGKPLRRVTRTVLAPSRGQVVVRNHATSVNFHDLVGLDGLMENCLNPRVPFSDNSCEIVAVGADCGTWQVGDRVLVNFFRDWTDGPPIQKYLNVVYGDQLDGFLQQYVPVEASALVRTPAHLSHTEAATLCCAGLAAWRSVYVEGNLRAGQTVVIQGTGGVALQALQITKALGGIAIVTSSSDEKLARARALGADHCVNYRSNPDWDIAVLEITGGHGADVIVDIGGADTLSRSINAARTGGQISIVGARGALGVPSAIPVEKTLIKNLMLCGITVGSRRHLEKYCALLALTGIRPVIDTVYPFDETDKAVARMRSQNHFGKLVIEI